LRRNRDDSSWRGQKPTHRLVTVLTELDLDHTLIFGVVEPVGYAIEPGSYQDPKDVENL
jgi:hypothetical protein